MTSQLSETEMQRTAGNEAWQSIRVVEVRQMTLACPSQWEGLTDDGYWIYARYRGGRGEIHLAPSEQDFEEHDWGTYRILHWDTGARLDGYLTFGQLKARTKGRITWP